MAIMSHLGINVSQKTEGNCQARILPKNLISTLSNRSGVLQASFQNGQLKVAMDAHHDVAKPLWTLKR